MQYAVPFLCLYLVFLFYMLLLSALLLRLGPMKNELKQRKVAVRREYTKPNWRSARPEEVGLLFRSASPSLYFCISLFFFKELNLQ